MVWEGKTAWWEPRYHKINDLLVTEVVCPCKWVEIWSICLLSPTHAVNYHWTGTDWSGHKSGVAVLRSVELSVYFRSPQRPPVIMICSVLPQAEHRVLSSQNFHPPPAGARNFYSGDIQVPFHFFSHKFTIKMPEYLDFTIFWDTTSKTNLSAKYSSFVSK